MLSSGASLFPSTSEMFITAIAGIILVFIRFLRCCVIFLVVHSLLQLVVVMVLGVLSSLWVSMAIADVIVRPMMWLLVFSEVLM